MNVLLTIAAVFFSSHCLHQVKRPIVPNGRAISSSRRASAAFDPEGRTYTSVRVEKASFTEGWALAPTLGRSVDGQPRNPASPGLLIHSDGSTM
jgi:hypothetical protein